MWWKILNKLFGNDYIIWKDSCNSGITRVYSDQTGRPYFFKYGMVSCVVEIKKEDQVLWLTCGPSKYLLKDMYGNS